MVLYCSGYVQFKNKRFLYPIKDWEIIDSDFVVSKSGQLIDLCDPNMWEE
jgi:hypothetical protein